MALAQVLDAILEREGGFVNDPEDPGGATKYGITRDTLAQWRGGPVSLDEVAALEEEEARAIYRARYYEAPGFDRAPQALQPFLVDAAVNHGPATAVKILQRVLRAAGAASLAADGIFGPETQEAAEAAWRRLGDWLLAALADERRRVYFALTARNPRLEKFLDGWLARANSFDPRGAAQEEQA